MAVDFIPGKGTAERVRPWLFADQDLDVLLARMELEGEANRALALLSSGKVKEAAQVLTPEVRQANGPGAELADAWIQQQQGNPAGAEALLRGLLRDTGIEPRWRMWAAHALRRMGRKLDEDVANELLGVVVETLRNGEQAFAVYPDGNLRNVNRTWKIGRAHV